MTTSQTTRPDPTDVDRGSTDSRAAKPTPGETTLDPGRKPEAGALPLDLVFESLKNSRRRQVLRYLQDGDEPASVSELAEHVAAIENDTTVDALSSQQRKRVYVGLYQCHLPKLDDTDIVEYDDDRGTVTLGPNAPQLERYLHVADGTDRDDDRSWPHYYFGVAGVGAVMIALAVLGVGGTIGPAAVATILGLTVALAALAAVHARKSA